MNLSILFQHLSAFHSLIIGFSSCTQRFCNRICIARLYGGGPPLYTCPSLIPTLAEPLTTGYTHPSAPKVSVPQGHHPATPRFLLSLLSTAIYLSISSVALEALQRILASVGPRTVVRYLHYAIGRGIGAEDEGPGADLHAAVGLEHIGKDLGPQVDDASSHSHSLNTSSHAASREASMHTNTAEPELEAKLGEVHLSEQPDDGASLLSLSGTYFYGAVGDRIGEAAACFLARWGVDLFTAEEGGLPPTFSTPSPLHGTTTTTTTAAADTNIGTTTGATYTRAHQASDANTAQIWTRALSARWVRGLVSSDAFFVQGELKRYEFARRVVELRRNLNGVIREEEREWRKLFEDGIYYTNLVSGFFLACNFILFSVGLVSHVTLCSHGRTSNEFRKTARPPLGNHTSLCSSCRQHTGSSRNCGTG